MISFLETELLEHLFLTAEVLWQVESRAFWQVETWAFSTSIISCETSSRDNQLAIFLSACFCLSVSFVWFFIKSQTDFHYILKLFSFSAAYRSHTHKNVSIIKKVSIMSYNKYAYMSNCTWTSNNGNHYTHMVRSDMSTGEVNPKPLGYLVKFLLPFSILYVFYHWQLNFLLKSSPEF